MTNFLFGPFLSPECTAFAFFTLAIFRSSLPCVTDHFAGSASTLPE
jgi:hypothetical protein